LKDARDGAGFESLQECLFYLPGESSRREGSRSVGNSGDGSIDIEGRSTQFEMSRAGPERHALNPLRRRLNLSEDWTLCMPCWSESNVSIADANQRHDVRQDDHREVRSVVQCRYVVVQVADNTMKIAEGNNSK